MSLFYLKIYDESNSFKFFFQQLNYTSEYYDRDTY